MVDDGLPANVHDLGRRLRREMLRNIKMFDTGIEANTPEWLEARKGYLSASDVSAVLGVNRWKTWADVKSDDPKVFSDEQLKKFRAGHLIEDALKIMWSEEKPGRLVFEGKSTLWTDGFLAATPDGFGHEGSDGYGLIEAKSVGSRLMKDWENGPPLYVFLQVQAQLMCTGESYCDVVAAIGGPGYQEWRIEAHEGVQCLIRDAAEAYMTEEPNAELQVTWCRALHDMGFEQPTGKRFPAGNPALAANASQSLADALRLTRAARNAAQADYDKALRDAQEQMGDAEYLTVGDEVLATWKTSSRKRLDKNLLSKFVSPSVIESCYSEYKFRTFLVKDAAVDNAAAMIW